MVDRYRVVALVGHKVAVGLNNVDARGVENLDRVVPVAQRPGRRRCGDPRSAGEGEIEVEVARLVSLGFDEEIGEEIEADSC